jgi:hypothetical protein
MVSSEEGHHSGSGTAIAHGRGHPEFRVGDNMLITNAGDIVPD